MGQTEFQPKLLASHTISNAKTDEIFTNLLIQHGRKALIRHDDEETYFSRREKLEYYGKVSGTPVKYSSEIFLGMIDDQESANSILVVGKAGIGKSLFCQKVIRDWANNELFQARENNEIPNLKFVYLLTFRQLNLLKKKHLTLREILNFSLVLNSKCNINDSTFEYIANHPKEVMIILDGYDEYSQKSNIAGNLEEQYPNDARRKMPVAALCSKLIKGKILKGAIVMITSRPDESDKLGGICFKHYVEIAGFSSKQVKRYIEKYFKKNENMKNAVLKHVMNNGDLVSLAHIPMLCYLLCFEMEYTLTESENPDDLPVSTTDVYTKLVDIFELKHCAESEYRQKEIPEQFKAPPVIKNTLDKLSKLAAKLLVKRKPTFDESEIEGDFEAEEVHKLKGSGLLYCGQPFRTALITTTKHFSFTHLTVQEFLAARWFVKENCVPYAKFSNMFFQFMAGVLSSEGDEELMEKLLDSPVMNLNLKMKCLKEYQSKEFAKKFIKNDVQLFCNSDGVMAFANLSDEDYFGVSFVLDIISELNKEEGGEARLKFSDKFVTVRKLELEKSRLTLSGMQRLFNSLNNEHCLVSELKLLNITLTDECDEYDDVIDRLLWKLTTLSLQRVEITDAIVTRLCKALQHPSCKLTTLNLKKNDITDTGVARLSEVLQHPSCKLTTLNLKKIDITDTDAASLCEALQHASCKLTALDLGYITDTDVASLSEALQHPSCKLTTLNLKSTDISNNSVSRQNEASQYPSCNLTTEEFLYIGITDISAASLCKALQYPSCKLTVLNLKSTYITDTGVASLSEALKHPSCKLTTLNLKLEEITDFGVASLCKALQHPSCKLTSVILNLKCNVITDIGVASLCEALQHPSCKLTTLDLRYIEITNISAASLCKALQYPSCKLTTLNLKKSFITDTGVASLSEALQHPSCKLTTLDLWLCRVTDIGFASLREALKHPRCKLTTLTLQGHYITDASVACLCEALQHSSYKLTTLNLPFDFISDTGVASLREAFQYPSCKLTTLNLPSRVLNLT